MAIRLDDLLKLKSEQFGMGASAPQMGLCFLAAVNNVLQDIGIDLDAAPIAAASSDDTLALDSYCLPAIDAGVDVWLLRYGNKSGELNLATAEVLYDKARRKLRTNRDMAASRASTDGQVIGLF